MYFRLDLTYTLKVCNHISVDGLIITKSCMSKRINIVLPDRTLAVLDKVARKGNRSQIISRAVLYFVESQGKETLRERLKHEALENAERDVAMAAEWFALEEEVAERRPEMKRRSRASKTKQS
jgi:CopG family transcriptional regulator/antitoxin EndoAI